MLTKHDFRLGDEVEFETAYHRDCKKRFRNFSGRTSGAQPLKSDFIQVGIVVGLRNVYMSGYKYNWGGGDEQSYSTGKTEWMLLVCKSIYDDAVLVRFADVYQCRTACYGNPATPARTEGEQG